MAHATASPTEAFQFTRPRGARRDDTPIDLVHRIGFNSRARKRRDEDHIAVRRGQGSFNSRARKRRDTCRQSLHARLALFQFTRPQEARLRGQVELCAFAGFQFTRPRGARLQARSCLRALPRVSIHAPARGATPGTWPSSTRRTSFNSRAREGRDPPPTVLACRRRGVSIHAPARGATHARPRRGSRSSVSIHAPARGATLIPQRPLFFSRFQFTRPQGARREVIYNFVFLRGFNSRARKGRDTIGGRRLWLREVSIHAPARGATPPIERTAQVIAVLIHAPARGATMADHAPTRQATFQFTRPQGARPG